MSVLISSAEYGSKPSFAIEADPSNYQKTVQNCQLNGNRFEHVHKAVFSESGKTVTLFGVKHEAFSMLEEQGGAVRAEVETIALDDLSDWLKEKGNLPTILKLDVEGVEIDALKGAGKILKGDCLVNYEEHGADKDHEVSRYLKDELGMRLFFGDNDGKFMREITSWSELDKIKTNISWGYDLFAASSELWITRLEGLVEKTSPH
ncbi:MAG: FkbM family methyltransferase [Proteobacteria bacterium]|nr:FkbM family methyltransferase [Pseudomonadota bacterium]